MINILKNLLEKNPIILEIGIFKGGSIDMWNYYFDNNCTIYAIDINKNCLNLKKDYGDNVNIIIGDQGNDKFWDNFLSKNIKFDIILDDGSHIPSHQILTFKKTYDYLNNNGIYLCEDICTSYHKKYNNSFIDFCKTIIDYLNVYHLEKKYSQNI